MSETSAWAAILEGATEPALTDDELDALRRILFEQGETVSREAQIELLETALWYRGLRREAPIEPPLREAGAMIRGLQSARRDLPEDVTVTLRAVESAIERANEAIAEVYRVHAETEDADRRAESVRALVRGWR